MMNKGASADHAVEIRGLRVRRGGSVIFDGLDAAIPRGRVVGVLGPSGCGKTTLMRAIVGTQRIASGVVRVLGRPAGAQTLRRRVSYATQAASVYDDLTVRQNLRYFARALGLPPVEAERVLRLVRLEPHAQRRVDALSGGQRNRVSLAAALLGSPELIVLDEPTVGLDPVLRAELWELFRALAGEGATLLVSSHVMDEALRCDRLLLMREGRILADTTPEGLLETTGERDPEAAFLALLGRRARHGAGAADPGSGASEQREDRR